MSQLNALSKNQDQKEENAFENLMVSITDLMAHLSKEKEFLDTGYTLQDMQITHYVHERLSSEYFAQLDNVEKDGLLQKFSQKERETIHEYIATLMNFLMENQEKITQLQENAEISLRLYQKSAQKSGSYYTHRGMRHAPSVSTWKESF